MKKEQLLEGQANQFIENVKNEGYIVINKRSNKNTIKQIIDKAMSGKFKTMVIDDIYYFVKHIENGIAVIEDLRKKGIDVYFKKEDLHSINTENNVMIYSLLDCAEKERQIKSDRMKWSLEMKKRKV